MTNFMPAKQTSKSEKNMLVLYKVNKIKKKHLYPIPIMSEILDAFIVRRKGMYQLKRVPFRLSNWTR